MKCFLLKSYIKFYSGVFVLLTFASCSQASAACSSEGMQSEACVKMRLNFCTTRFFRYRAAHHVRFQELESKKVWDIEVKKCPDLAIGQIKYVQIDRACNDTGKHEHDRILFWDPQECELNPVENYKRVQSLIETIKPGISSIELEKLNFHLHSRNQATGSWKYHSYPGVTIDAKMIFSKSPGDDAQYKLDEREAYNNYVLDKIISIRTEFVTARECEMWNGKVTKTQPRYVECDFFRNTNP